MIELLELCCWKWWSVWGWVDVVDMLVGVKVFCLLYGFFLMVVVCWCFIGVWGCSVEGGWLVFLLDFGWLFDVGWLFELGCVDCWKGFVGGFRVWIVGSDCFCLRSCVLVVVGLFCREVVDVLVLIFFLWGVDGLKDDVDEGVVGVGMFVMEDWVECFLRWDVGCWMCCIMGFLFLEIGLREVEWECLWFSWGILVLDVVLLVNVSDMVVFGCVGLVGWVFLILMLWCSVSLLVLKVFLLLILRLFRKLGWFVLVDGDFFGCEVGLICCLGDLLGLCCCNFLWKLIGLVGSISLLKVLFLFLVVRVFEILGFRVDVEEFFLDFLLC